MDDEVEVEAGVGAGGYPPRDLRAASSSAISACNDGSYSLERRIRRPKSSSPRAFIMFDFEQMERVFLSRDCDYYYIYC